MGDPLKRGRYFLDRVLSNRSDRKFIMVYVVRVEYAFSYLN